MAGKGIVWALCVTVSKAPQSVDRLQNVECLWCNIIALIIVFTIHLKTDSGNVCCHEIMTITGLCL